MKSKQEWREQADKLWQYCDICKCKHLPIEVYRDWLLKHGDKYKEQPHSKKKLKITKQSAQILRWRAIVDRHGTRRE